ncbi:exopolysaccharide biosynthesis protein [Halomonas sp. BC04]|uniref:exopolysaccharide biosynthesis protein n=1 Tax=Halomonas sp. BC04 TaxID=1403540 RepID=UPI0003ED6F8D|nr:exopolysaccharide biosynthesis protein [Halomonas sp. BC04]EWH03174.1 exopolysaccharide biosynthesis protein [Halomonas sp. BC04]
MERDREDNAEEMREPHNLAELIAVIEAIESPSGQISFDEVLEAAGRRSFGPLLLLAGLVTLMPIISGIPGVPSLMGLFTVLVCVQLLLGRRTFWLPAWLRNRTVASDKVRKGLKWMYKPASMVDRMLYRRLSFMVGKRAMQLIAVVCVVLALAMPPMEFVPFSVNIAGVALTLFGLSLMARDGLLALIAFLISGTTLAGIVHYLA